MKRESKGLNEPKGKRAAKYKKPELVKFRNLLRTLHGVTQTAPGT